MLFFLITCCFSFIFFYNSWGHEMRRLSLWSLKSTVFCLISSVLASRMSPRKKQFSPKVERVEGRSGISVLDLPDLAVETILEKLPPEELCRMASVSTCLREMCVSDHLWEHHMNKKWSRIVGPAAYKEWQCRAASGNGPLFSDEATENGLLRYLTQLWPFVLITSSFSTTSKNSNFPPPNSTMSWYFALESGKFWFPAQVYNRENGHVGFMLSCYDAEICYDLQTNTFKARNTTFSMRRARLLKSPVQGRNVTRSVQ